MTLVKVFMSFKYIVTFTKHPDHYISYMLYERLREEEQIHPKKYLLEMTPSRAKMRLKRRPQKRNF